MNPTCIIFCFPSAPITPNAFFAVRGAFFELFSVGSERSARCLCATGASRFRRLLCLHVFAGTLWAPEVEKKQLWAEKHPTSSRFFSIVQSNERRGGPSVVVTKVYRCLESTETTIMETCETCGVCRGFYPELYFFKVFVNMTVYLTAKKQRFLERSRYNPLIRLTGQLIWWLPSNIKKPAAHCSFLIVKELGNKHEITSWSSWFLSFVTY